MTGPSFTFEQKPINYINYVYKPLDSKFKHFGARLRIIGKVENNEVRGQTPVGSMTYYVVPGTDPSQNISIGGGSGGLGVMVNPTNNVGYYFEIAALTETNIDKYANGSTIANLLFYKIGKDNDTDMAVPVKLWSGSTNILVDDGNFTGQYRMTGESNPTVYDIAVEYLDIGQTRKFYLYINNNIVAIVDDTNPLPIYNNMCLFTRGTSKIMFENIFALGSNYAKNVSENIDIPFNKIFDNQELTSSDAFRKYALSSVIQSTYLSGISPSEPPSYNFYFDEFGSIMRECAYFNVKFDKAYPALTSLMSPIPASLGGYVVAGYNSTPYRAEFLLFNTTDFVLDLGANKDYLDNVSITGITFTQEAARDLTVDEFLTEKSNYTSSYVGAAKYTSVEYKNKYTDIKNNRLLYGSKSFVIDSPYIQTVDLAQNLMNFVINRISKPRKVAAVSVFGMHIIQLGDIVSFVYDTSKTLPNTVSGNNFVVYASEYQREETGPSTILYLSEVL
jgi:hypothetical protein